MGLSFIIGLYKIQYWATYLWPAHIKNYNDVAAFVASTLLLVVPSKGLLVNHPHGTCRGQCCHQASGVEAIVNYYGSRQVDYQSDLKQCAFTNVMREA